MLSDLSVKDWVQSQNIFSSASQMIGVPPLSQIVVSLTIDFLGTGLFVTIDSCYFST
jgi:hypothetical protein